MSKTVQLPTRKVVGKKGGYVVCELRGGDLIEVWEDVSKVYGHSTSAFAALGRLTQQDTLAQQ